AVLLVPRLRDRDAAGATAAPLLAYLLLGANVLPWYAVWVLPALLATARRRLGLVVVALAAVFQLAELPGGRAAGPAGAPLPVAPWLHRLQSGTLYVAVPVMEATAALVLLVLAVTAPWGTRPAAVGAPGAGPGQEGASRPLSGLSAP
ncbi:MAG TPA: hypothetical protein VKI64_10585, partial [Acidimicrobiales bacterium]|nr:hypothetical protein [Acidimicrobiales bacterium]